MSKKRFLYHYCGTCRGVTYSGFMSFDAQLDLDGYDILREGLLDYYNLSYMIDDVVITSFSYLGRCVK